MCFVFILYRPYLSTKDIPVHLTRVYDLIHTTGIDTAVCLLL
jgi:hypothetical protein